MALSAFDDRTREPNSEGLYEVLGDAAEMWTRLIVEVRMEFDPLAEDWVFSGKKWGWALRLKHKKRAVLYMTPTHGSFLVGFALGEKAVAAARGGALPQSILKCIDGAQKYAEGRAVRFEVRSDHDVDNVIEVARIKMAN